MAYNLLISGIYGGYNPFTNHLLTSWDIQVDLLRERATVEFVVAVFFCLNVVESEGLVWDPRSTTIWEIYVFHFFQVP